MATVKTYDPKCHELAALFLGDEPDLHTEANIRKLALEIQQTIEKNLFFLDNPYIHTFIVISIGLYASVLAPRVVPTSGIKDLFNSPIFKVFFFFVVLLLAHKDPRVALIVALAFVFTMQSLQHYNIMDKLKGVYGYVLQRPTLYATDVEPQAPSVHLQTVQATSQVDQQPNFDQAFDQQFPDQVQFAEDDSDLTQYQVSDGENQVGRPAYDDAPHAFTQGLGEPLPGFDSDNILAAAPY